MGKKRVPISLRKPPSPDTTAAPVKDEVAAEAAPPAAPEPEVAARVAEPEVVVAEPVAVARVAEPPAAPAAEDALQRFAPEAPPAIFVSADGRPMRAVTVYLPAELADRLMLYCLEQGRDVVREAIEASLSRRLGAGAEASAAAPFAEKARPGFRERVARRGLVARVERWIELGRAVMTSLRVQVQQRA
jgi:hypothetical protein